MRALPVCMLAGFLSMSCVAEEKHDELHTMKHEEEKITAGLAVHHGWIRLMPAVAKSSAGYFVLHNFSKRDVVLLAVSSTIAKDVSLHRTITENGISRMESLEQLLIPANGKVIFEPGTKHLMLSGLRAALENQQKVRVTFTFDRAESLQAAFVVSAGSSGNDSESHQHH